MKQPSSMRKMMSSKWFWAAVVTLSSFCALWSIHGNVLIHPNSYSLSTEGEGARVYFVLASHAKNDSSYVNFEGMNYPFGEHIVYCDAQPLVANSFRFLTTVFPSFQGYAVGFQNTLSLYALIVAALLLYLVFIRWDIPPWYAALAAFAIMLIGPQITRMPWQPGLAYPFIPGLLLLYQQFIRSRSWKITAVISVVNLLLFLINPYLGVTGVGLFLLVGLFVKKREGWKPFTQLFQLLAQTAAPSLLYTAWVSATDDHLDRVRIPTGFDQFMAQGNTVFASINSPLSGLYESLGVDPLNASIHWEGWAYVGLSVTLLLAAFLGLWIRTRVSKTNLNIGFESQHKILLVVCLIFLLFGMGFPFNLHQSFESLLDIFPPIRQLRALGRFAWFFAVGMNVLAFYGLYHFVKNHLTAKWKWAGWSVAVVLFGLTSFEGIYLHIDAAENQTKENVFAPEKLAESQIAYLAEPIDSVDFSKYCAILPLPYYHIGSELFTPPTRGSFRIVLESVALSYYSGLPLMSSHLSRLSASETMATLQLFSSPILEKELQNHLQSDKPILVFYSKKGLQLHPAEKRILALGTTIYETDYAHFVEVWPADIWEMAAADFLDDFNVHREAYKQADSTWTYPPTSQPWIYESYDDQQTEIALHNGALDIDAQADQYFFCQSSTCKELAPGKYMLSFWFECSINRSQAVLIREELHAESAAVISSEEFRKAGQTFDFHKGWKRYEIEIDYDPDENWHYRFEAPYNIEHLYIDNLLLIKKEQSVFIELDDGNWLWNGWPLQRENRKLPS
jgi:hypothetical protein